MALNSTNTTDEFSVLDKPTLEVGLTSPRNDFSVLDKEPTELSTVQKLNNNLNTFSPDLRKQYLKSSVGKSITEKLELSDALQHKNLSKTRSAFQGFAQAVGTTLAGTVEGAGTLIELGRKNTGMAIGIKMEFEDKPFLLERGLKAAGKWTRQKAEELFPTNPEYQDTWTNKISSGLGSAAAFMLPGSIIKGARYMAPLVTGALSLGNQEYHQALEATGSEDKALEAFLFNLPIGATEAIPIGNMFKRLDKWSGGGVKQVLKNTLRQGAEELIQESVQSGLSGFTANQLYDAQRDLVKEMTEGGTVGFVVGAILGSAGNTMVLRKKTASPEDAIEIDKAIKDNEALRKKLSGKAETVLVPEDFGLNSRIDNPKVQKLVDIGFTKEQAENMLQENGYENLTPSEKTAIEPITLARLETETKSQKTAIEPVTLARLETETKSQTIDKTAKTRIREITGQKDMSDKIEISSKKALANQLSSRRKGSMEGFREGKAYIKEQLIPDRSKYGKVIKTLMELDLNENLSPDIKKAREIKAHKYLKTLTYSSSVIKQALKENLIDMQTQTELQEFQSLNRPMPLNEKINVLQEILGDGITRQAQVDMAEGIQMVSDVSDMAIELESSDAAKNVMGTPNKAFRYLSVYEKLQNAYRKTLIEGSNLRNMVINLGNGTAGQIYKNIFLPIRKQLEVKSQLDIEYVGGFTKFLDAYLPADAAVVKDVAGYKADFYERLAILLHATNPQGRSRLLNSGQISLAQLRALEAGESSSERVIKEHILELNEKIFPLLNKAVNQAENRDLGYVANYFPHHTKPGYSAASQVDEFETNAIRGLRSLYEGKGGLYDDFINERLDNVKLPLNVDNAIQQQYAHLESAIRYIAYAPILRNTTRKMNKITHHVIENFGKDIADNLNNNIKYAFFGEHSKGDLINNTAETLRRRAMKAITSTRITMMLNQTAVLPNYVAATDSASVAQAVAEVMSNPNKAIDETFSDWKILEARSIEFGMSVVSGKLKYSKPGLLDAAGLKLEQISDLTTQHVRYMDKLMIAIGYRAGELFHLKNGGSQETMKEAGLNTVEETNSMSHDLYRPPMQQNSQLAKILFAFTSQVTQVSNQGIHNKIQYKANKLNKIQYTSKQLNTYVVPSVMVAAMGIAFKKLVDTEDKDPSEELALSIAQNTLGSFNPFLGWMASTSRYGFGGIVMTIPEKFLRGSKAIYNENYERGIGLFTEGALNIFGISVDQPGKIGKKVLNMMNIEDFGDVEYYFR